VVEWRRLFQWLWWLVTSSSALYCTWDESHLVTPVRSWRKLHPHVQNGDLQGLRIEEMIKSEIVDMVCAMRSFEYIGDNVEELVQRSCELVFQHMKYGDVIGAAAKQSRAKWVVRMREIRIAARRSLNSSQTKRSSQNKRQSCKKTNAICSVLWTSKTKYFRLCVFFDNSPFH
jgi:hypothetical protein